MLVVVVVLVAVVVVVVVVVVDVVVDVVGSKSISTVKSSVVVFKKKNEGKPST